MKRAYLPPLLLLGVILLLSLWNSSYMARETERWQSQVARSGDLALAEQWPEAMAALEDSYNDWQQRQTYLHIVLRHDILDNTEAMYRRAAAFAVTREAAEFQAEIENLRHQLALIAETEQFHINNML